MAFDREVGCIVVDSLDEIALADAPARSRAGGADPADPRDRAVDAFLRSRPASSTRSSASGSRAGRAAACGRGGRRLPASAPRRLPRSHRLADPRARAVRARDRGAWPGSAGEYEPRVINVGGGLGIAYSAGDEPPSIEAYVDVKVDAVREVFDPLPKILFEPGRSLVGNAGITIYSVGTVKEIPGVRTYVAVDGGMSDNLRPMLYGSRYEALIADRAAAAPPRPGDDRRQALRVRRRPGPRRAPRRPAARRRPRRRPRPAPTATRWPTTTTASRGRRWSSAATATRASSSAARPTRI